MQPTGTPVRVRKRPKVRSVWISFAGRIAAQIIGAVATVTLGVVVLGKGQAPAMPAAHAKTVAPTVLIATPIRTHGETVIVMLPAGADGRIDRQLASDVAESYETSTLPAANVRARLQTPTGQPAPRSIDLSADSRATLESPREPAPGDRTTVQLAARQ